MRIYFIISLIFIGLSCNLSHANNTKAYHSDSLDVIHYTINLAITSFTSKQIAGNTVVRLTPKVNNLQNISLDLLMLTVDSIYINSQKMNNFGYNDTLITIPTNNPLNTTDTVNVTVYYHGQPVKDPSTWGGFYFSTTDAFNLGVGFDDNPHNYGRIWFPCIDDFIDKATYDCFITVKNPNKAICGGTLVEVITASDTTKTYHWNLKDPISTYMASVAVSNYTAVKDTFNGIMGKVPIEIYVNPTDSVKAINSFINLKSILAGYENRFGPYVWERVGYVGVTFSSGAMEHATNIAYPKDAINGQLTNESLYAHELSHHWFGDYITCNSPLDMWINEGWAVYCESIYKEWVYGTQAMKDYHRSKFKEVLRYAHIEDAEYRAVYGIPHEYTYGTTVYEKGSCVAHSLRGYLGDSLFFNGMKAFLSNYAFQSVSSIQLRDFLSNYSGVDLTDFFDFHVFNPGFTHFSIDSFKVVPTSSLYEVTVFVKQKLKGTTNYANSNKVEVTFMDQNWNKHTEILSFSGTTGSQTFYIPINPAIAMLDPEEKFCDATTDFYKTIKTIGTIPFATTYFDIAVSEIADSAFLRVEHNWVAPDPLKTAIPGLILSDYRYWKIDGILPVAFKSKGRFYYNSSLIGTSGMLDNTLITNALDSLVLLYRSNPSCNWQITSFTNYKMSKYIIADTLKLGEYTLAIWDWDRYISIEDIQQKTNDNWINIFPNPASKKINISFSEKIGATFTIELQNIQGKIVRKIKTNKNNLEFDLLGLSTGIYFLRVSNNKLINTKKIVIQ